MSVSAYDGAPGLPISRQPRLPLSDIARVRPAGCSHHVQAATIAAWARPVVGAWRGPVWRRKRPKGAGSHSSYFSASGELREHRTFFQALTWLWFLGRDQRPGRPFPPGPTRGSGCSGDRLHPQEFRNCLPIMELTFLEGSLCVRRCVQCFIWVTLHKTPNTSTAWVPGSSALTKEERKAQRG